MAGRASLCRSRRGWCGSCVDGSAAAAGPQATGRRRTHRRQPKVADPRFADLPGAHRRSDGGRRRARWSVRRRTARPTAGHAARDPGGLARAAVACPPPRDARRVRVPGRGRRERTGHRSRSGGRGLPRAGRLQSVALRPGPGIPELLPRRLHRRHCARAPVPELAANLATQFIQDGHQGGHRCGLGRQTIGGRVVRPDLLCRDVGGRAIRRRDIEGAARIIGASRTPTRGGAYQCYGDRSLCSTESNRLGRPGRRCALRELVLEADAIATQAKTADESAFQALRDRLDKTVDARVSVGCGTRGCRPRSVPPTASCGSSNGRSTTTSLPASRTRPT